MKKNNFAKIMIACTCMTLLPGCVVNKESTQTDIPTESLVEVEKFHDTYERSKVLTTIKQEVGSSTIYNKESEGYGQTYGYIKLSLGQLFDDSSIIKLDYIVEEGSADIMNETDFNAFSFDEQESMVLGEAQQNKTYICSTENQEQVYLKVYYKYSKDLSKQQSTTAIQNAVRKVLLKVYAESEDGSEELHRYAFDFNYEYNLNVQLYELTEK